MKEDGLTAKLNGDSKFSTARNHIMNNVTKSTCCDFLQATRPPESPLLEHDPMKKNKIFYFLWDLAPKKKEQIFA